jgi:hypothetical protein
MSSTMVELRVCPPLERPHIVGVLARLTIPHPPTTACAEIQAHQYQALDWMEHEPEATLRSVEPRKVDAERAQAILMQVTAVRTPLVASSELGIHETSYRLRVWRGASFCEFNWWRELPREWQSLAPIVSGIEEIASEVLNAV